MPGLTLNANAGTVAASNAETAHAAIDPNIIANSLDINASTLTLRNWMKARGGTSTITVAAGGVLTIAENYSLIAGSITNDLVINAPQIVVNVAGTGTDEITVAASSIVITTTGSGSTITNTDNESLILSTSGGHGNANVRLNVQDIDLGNGNLTLDPADGSDIFFTNANGISIKATNLTLDARNITAQAGSTKTNLTLEATGTLTFSHTISAIIVTVADITLTSAETISVTTGLTINAAGDINLNSNLESTASSALSLTAGTGSSINFGVAAGARLSVIGAAGVSFTSPSAQSPASSGGVEIRAHAGNLTLSGNYAVAGNFTIAAGIVPSEAQSNNRIVVFAGGAAGAHSITANAISVSQSGSYTQTGALPEWVFNPLPSASRSNTPVGDNVVAWDNAVPLSPGNIVHSTGTMSLLNLIVGKFALTGATLNLDSFNLTVTGGTLTIPSSITTITTTGAITLTGATITLNHALTLTGNTLMIGADLDAGTGALNINGAMTFSTNVVLSGANIALNGAVGTSNNNLTLTSAGNLNLGGDVYTLGTGDLTLTYAGTLTAPSASSTTDNLSITNNGANSSTITYAAWMDAAGRDLTLISTSGDIGSIKTINLGTGNLTLVASRIFVASGGTYTITAGDVAITGRSTNSGGNAGFQGIGSGINLTINASGDITISSSHIDFNNSSLTLRVNAGNEILFRKNTTITDVGNLTLGRTIKAEDASNKYNLAINASTINFSGDTEISGANISLNSSNAQASGNRSLTITATGTVALNGAFNLGTSSLTLDQAGALNGTATLTTPNLTITYRGTAEFRVPSWAAATSRNVSITTTAASVRFTNSFDLCDGANANCGDLTVDATDTAPSRSAIISFFTSTHGVNQVAIIEAGNITLTSDSISNLNNGNSNSVRLHARGGNLTLDVGELNFSDDALTIDTISASGEIRFTRAGGTTLNVVHLTLGGTITSAGNLTIDANSLTFVGVTTILVQGNVSLTSASAQNSASDANLTITANPRSLSGGIPAASGNVTLRGGFNIGTGSLVLTAGAPVGGDATINLTDGGALAITAANLTLNQPSGTSYPTSLTSGYTFTVSGNIYANINSVRLGVGEADWDSVFRVFGDTTISEAGNYDLATLFTDIILDENGILDFGGFSLTVNLTGSSSILTFPSNVRGIKNASAISLTAGSITGISGGDFSLATTTGAITLGIPSIDVGANTLTLTSGGALSFTVGTTLAALDIIISAGGDVATANNSLTLTALRSINLGGGVYDLGTGALSLTYGFAAESTGSISNGPTTLTTPDLSITNTSIHSVEYASWMQPASGDNRNLTITAMGGGINLDGDINLGTTEGESDLVLNGFNVTVDSASVITAGDITITTTSAGTGRTAGIVGLAAGGAHLTLTATGDITITATNIDLNADGSGANNLTLSVGSGKEILFTKATTITDVAVLTIGGTIRANNGTNNVDLTLDADTIRFNGITNITALRLTLTSTNAQTPADADATPGNLTINISGNLRLRGNFNIGTGALDVDGTILDINSAVSFEAATIDLTLTDTNSGSSGPIRKANSFGSYGLTLIATTINISATEIFFGRGRDGADLTLTAANVNFLKGITINVDTLTLGGTVNVTGSLTLVLSQAPIFTANTTITAAAISIDSNTNAGDKSTVGSVILRADGDITLTGNVINITGAVDFHADFDDSDAGDVVFAGGAVVITADGAIILRQGGTAFPLAAPSGVTFSVTPTIYFRDAVNTNDVTATGTAWAEDGNNLLFGFTIEDDTTTITDAQGNTITIDASDGLSAAELGLIFVALGLSDNPASVNLTGYDITINITGAITFPAALTEIIADDISITALSLSGGNSANLTIRAVEDTLTLAIAGGIARSAGLNLEVAGGTLDISGTGALEGTEAVTLSYTTLTGTPAITTASLTITYGGSANLNIAEWMVGEGRTLDITALNTLVNFNNSFSLCDGANANCGNLTVSALIINFNLADDSQALVVDAGTISLTATDTEGDASIINSNNESVTLNAREGNLTINSAAGFTLVTGNYNSSARATTLTLLASGTIAFEQTSGTFNLGAVNITLDAATITATGALNIDAEPSGAITFMRDTTITGSGAVTLDSPVAQDGASNPSLDITAVGNLTLTGAFNLGTGGLTLAYSGTLNGTPTLTANALTITHQGGGSLDIADWMDAAGRTVSITASSASVRFRTNSFNLCDGDDANCGNLTISSKLIIFNLSDDSAPVVINAGNITLTATDTEGDPAAIYSQRNESVTLNARAGDLTITTDAIDLLNGNTQAVTLTLFASGKIDFPGRWLHRFESYEYYPRC